MIKEIAISDRSTGSSNAVPMVSVGVAVRDKNQSRFVDQSRVMAWNDEYRTYMYRMLLRKLHCSVSRYHRKRYMTAPQDTLAKTGHA